MSASVDSTSIDVSSGKNVISIPVSLNLLDARSKGFRPLLKVKRCAASSEINVRLIYVQSVLCGGWLARKIKKKLQKRLIRVISSH